MSKTFFEVFPTLKVNQNIEMMFQGVEVTKVATNTNRDFIRVHILGKHLLQKKTVYDAEQLLKEQLFGRSSVQVEIVERYELSGQYTPENLMDEYKDSFILELGQRSAVERSMLRSASCTFKEGNILCLGLCDTIVSQGKKDSLTGYLKHVYEDRFGLDIDIRVTYDGAKESKLKYNDLKVRQEVDEILKASVSARREKGEEPEKESPKKTPEKKEAKKSSGGKSQSPGGAGVRRRDQSMGLRRSNDPNVVYGRDFDDEPIKLCQVVGEMGEIIFRGKVISFDTREIRNEKSIIMFAVTDFTDTIMVKMFVRNDQLPEMLGEVKKGAFLKIKGVTTIDKYDGELTIGSVSGIRKITDFTEGRQDTAPEKRVELHCHTKNSDMDGVSKVEDILKRAHDWGHKAVAITDHGVVQGFTEAHHYLQGLDKSDPFKVIYGVEGYLVDDLQDVAVNEKGQSLSDAYVVFDLETTGFSSVKDKIIEIGAVKVEQGKITERFSTFVNPKRPIPFEITQLTSINDQMVMEAPDIETVLPQFLDFVGDAALVAHNAGFDVGFIEQNCRYQDIVPDFTSVDTVAMARILLPTLSKFKLNIVANALHISLDNHHRAVDDANATAEIFVKFIEMLKSRSIHSLEKLNQFGAQSKEMVKKLPSYHVIILAKNQVGRTNL